MALWINWSNYISDEMYNDAFWCYSIVFCVLEPNKYRNLASHYVGALFELMTQLTALVGLACQGSKMAVESLECCS